MGLLASCFQNVRQDLRVLFPAVVDFNIVLMPMLGRLGRQSLTYKTFVLFHQCSQPAKAFSLYC